MPQRPPWEDYGPGDSGPAPWEEHAAQMGPLQGGGGATMGPAQPEGLTGVWLESARKLKEAIFGHPDRAEAKAAGIGLQPTPAELGETALAGGAAMAGGASMGGLAAHPVRTAMGLVGGFAGEKAGREVGGVAERMGAPAGTSAVAGGVGAVVGGMGGGGRVASTLRRRMGMEAAEEAATAAPLMSDGPRTLNVPQGMRRLPAQGGKVVQMPTAPSAAAGQAAEIQAKIVSLRSKGLSGAQITSSLRQLYPGYRPSEYQKMVDMVLEAAK